MMRFGVAVMCAALAGGSGTAQPSPSATPRMSSVSYRTARSGGQDRVVVPARFNGHPFPMMVHSNATFFVQLRHAQARAFGARDMTRLDGRYGIVASGQVSDLGRSRAIMDRVQVGDTVNRDVRVSVFEVPQDDLGMLGIDWIRLNGLIVDTVSGRVVLAPTSAYRAAMRTRLVRTGYTAVPMQWDATEQRYTVRAAIGTATGSMIVATASSNDIDPVFAQEGGVRQGARTGSGSGPTGEVVGTYATATPVAIRLGSWSAAPLRDFTIMDSYAYSGQPRPSRDRLIGGSLGLGFLTGNRAVIDFGGGTLYLKRP